MKYIFSFFFLVLFLSTGHGQLKMEERLNATIMEAEAQLRFYSIVTNTYACPPKISKASSDTLLYFLDALLPQNEKEKSQFLNRMMDEQCEAYYAYRIMDDYARPIYSKLLENYAYSRIYEMLPIALSASNPGLQINGDRAGIWQLSYVIARRYGLEINEMIDERFDITQSTYAAIQHFLFLEQQYPNRPLLVLSAFYTSVPYVNKKLRLLDDTSDDAFLQVIDQDLKAFLIYLLTWNEWIVNFKNDHKKDLISKAMKDWKNVELKDSVEIHLLAEFLGLDEKVIRKMNPMWIGDEFYRNEDHPFYLPKTKAEFVESHYDGFLNYQDELIKKEEEELAALKKRLANDVPDPKKYKAVNYTVKSGDVLGLIAQRYSVKVSSIKKWNKLSSDRINIGQTLVLYVPRNKEVDLPEEKAENKIELVEKEPKPGKGSYTSYTIKNGDSLWLIARKFPGVSAENIMEWNGISDKIKPGQVLKIYNE